MGFAWLAPVDHFLERHRIGGRRADARRGRARRAAALLAAASTSTRCTCKAPRPRRSRPFSNCASDPQTGANAIEIAEARPRRSAEQAGAASRRAARSARAPRRSPASSRPIRTAKLAAIGQTAAALAPALHPDSRKPPPTDADNVAALQPTRQTCWRNSPRNIAGPGGEAAKRLSGLLTRLAQAEPAARAAGDGGLRRAAARARSAMLDAALHPQPVTIDTLPEALRRAWLAPDGRGAGAGAAEGRPRRHRGVAQVSSPPCWPSNPARPARR